MRGGKLRKRLQIQTFAAAADAHGTPVKTWTTAATVWGAIEPQSGQKQIIADGMEAARITHKITIRFYPGLDSTMRIAYLDQQVSPNVTRVFAIKNILNSPEERRISQVLMCVEGAPNA